MDKYLERKFILVVLIVIAATALRVFDNLIDGGQWVTIVGGALTAFTVDNISQQWVSKG